MPRISPERRDARRASIVAAARRCFSRDGFHQTSMPAIAAEAGVSVGASYRYFAGKEDLILEVAGDAFRAILDPLNTLLARDEPFGPADLLAATVPPGTSGEGTAEDEALRCAIVAWAEILRRDDLRERATAGFDAELARIADGLRRGQDRGLVAADLDVDHTARLTMAVLHGLVVQRAAFGLEDPAALAPTLRRMVGAPADRPSPAGRDIPDKSMTVLRSTPRPDGAHTSP